MRSAGMNCAVGALLVLTFAGCPTCERALALHGSWTWTSDDFLPTTYVLELSANGDYEMAQFYCGGSCDTIVITRELGVWEACYSLSESAGQLHTRADNDAPINFVYEWDAQTAYRVLDANTLNLSMETPDGARIDTEWTRTN